MLPIIAPSRRQAFRWCREAGEDTRKVRVITRPEGLLGLSGVEVIVVDRGMCTGPVEQALDLAYRMEKAGHVKLRIVFTKG